MNDLIPSDVERNSAEWIQLESDGTNWTAKIGLIGGDVIAGLMCPRRVLGTYPSRQDAIAAAEAVIAMRGVPRLCTWRDVEAVRKENRQRSEMEVA